MQKILRSSSLKGTKSPKKRKADLLQSFEELGHTETIKYWYARDLMRLFDYKNYDLFRAVIYRTMAECTVLNISVAEHFLQVEREIDGQKNLDFKLTQFASYLTLKTLNQVKEVGIEVKKILESSQNNNSELLKGLKETIQRIKNKSEFSLHIESVKISNIKCFEDVELKFNPYGKTSLIIGTNARGKSTILQLIALGLSGINKVPFPYNWKKVVKTGNDKGSFELVFKINSELEGIFKFEIDENDEIKNSSFVMPDLDFLFVGYGASRHIKLEEPAPYKEIEPIATLFGENGYLKHIKISENYKYISENFDLIQALINAILDKADNVHKIRLEEYDTSSLYFRTPSNPHTVYFKKHPGPDNLIIHTLIPVEALSEGFKSTLVWLLDMIIRIVKKGGNIANADKIPGIVLIDEVDLHLHPSWQRTILPSLEQTFPNIQFIVTTHSPFVVQSAIGRNVIMLDFDNKTGSVKAVHKEINSELSYRAVVREIFDIQSPFSYDTEQEMNEFYQMRDKILKQEKVDEKKFKRLVEELVQKGVEIDGVMRRELRDLERRTGKTFDL